MTFLVDYKIKPEELRQMPIYDVYMIQYANIAKYINSLNKNRPRAFGSGEEKNLLGSG